MRTSYFGDIVIESVEDDLAMIEALQEAGGDIHAVIYADPDGLGKYDFEIKLNGTGEQIVVSDAIFNSAMEARNYLRYFVHDITEGG